MECPSCKKDFMFERDVKMESICDSEVEVMFTCYYCGEEFTVYVAQEDLDMPF